MDPENKRSPYEPKHGPLIAWQAEKPRHHDRNPTPSPEQRIASSLAAWVLLAALSAVVWAVATILGLV